MVSGWQGKTLGFSVASIVNVPLLPSGKEAQFAVIVEKNPVVRMGPEVNVAVPMYVIDVMVYPLGSASDKVTS